MTSRHASHRAAVVLAVAVAGALPVAAHAPPPADVVSDAAEAYAHGHRTLMTKPYSALVRIGVTQKTGVQRSTTDVVAFDAAASTAGYAVSNLRPSPFGALPVARMVGSGGRLYVQIENEPRAVIERETPLSRIYFHRGSPLVLPAPATLVDYVPDSSGGPGEVAFRASIEADAARRTVAEVIAGPHASRVAPRLILDRAVVRVTVDIRTGRLIRTHVHFRARVPATAFAGINVPQRTRALAGSHITVASRFRPFTLPSEPDVGVPEKTMPLADWADTVDARARILEAAVVLSAYRDMTGSLRGLTPRILRGVDPSLAVVHGRGTTRRGTVGLVVHPDRHGFTLRVTARNGWSYRADSRDRNRFVGTCRMAAGKSCGTWG